MPEKFDFSKIEDQKKFEKLPKEEQEKVITEAQEEASLINEIVGEKGSKEDYEMAAKLAEEEIASKKEIESLKEIYSQKLNGILNSQLTVENIETFADNALTQTINLTNDILLQYRNNLKLSSDTALSSGEQEDKVLAFFGLPDIPEILQSIVDVKEKIDNLKAYMRVNTANIDEVITPPDNKKISVGNRQGMEQKRMFPRVLTLLYILERDFNIPPADASITKGIITPGMVRQIPYARVEIPGLDRAVYLCDEEGNVSYVFDIAKIKEQGLTFDELDVYSKEDKNSLISRCHGIGIRIRQKNTWRNSIALALREPISETNISENIRQISEFKRERVEFLLFEDFQREVKNLYPGKGNVTKWYRKEYKNHNNWSSTPWITYEDKGWEGFPELVGKENQLKKEYLLFEDFQREVRNLYSGEGNIEKWYWKEYRNHKNWPSQPYKKYKDGWKGWPELVGKLWLPFEDFQKEVKEYYSGEGYFEAWYRKEYKNHKNWPSSPYKTYKDEGWKGWPELVEIEKK